jgi:hypothetical protein
MKFGLYKTAIEKKLVNSFVSENLTKDMKQFKDLVLNSEETKTLFFIYDKLNENLGLDKDSANILVDEVIKETKDIIIPNNHLEKLNKWLKNELSESEYSHIDKILNTNINKIEDRIESRKIVVENLMKEKQTKKTTPKLPISSLKKIANSVASKYLSNLDESTQKEVISLLKENEDVLEIKFNEEKEQVISKLNSLIESETEEETKKKINETKEKVTSTIFSVNELIKIKELNSHLVL